MEKVDWRKKTSGLGCCTSLVGLFIFLCFIFISIYLMLHLLPGLKFLFLQFLLRGLFLLCNIFWFGKICPFSIRIISVWQGELMYGLTRPRALYVLCSIFLGSFVHWFCSVTRESASKPSSSVSLCIFKPVQQKFYTLFGPLTLNPAPLLGLGKPTNSPL